nr:MAG TPA: hypothetical protein [Caudoviricetes sp.]
MLNFYTLYILQVFTTINDTDCFYEILRHLCCFSSAD